MGNRESLTCPTEAELWLHLDDPQASHEVAAHIQMCEHCRAVVDSLGSIEELIAKEEPLPEGFYERVLEIPTRRARRPWLVATTVAATAAVVLALFLARRQDRPVAPTLLPRPPRVTAPVPDPTPAVTSDDLATQVANALLSRDAAAGAFLDELGDDALGVLHRFARGKDVATARAAIRRLGALGRRESLPVLREALGREAYRDVAADSLGQVGDARAIPDLEVLLPDLRVMAAIATIGGKPAVEALRRRLPSAEEGEGALLSTSIGRIDGDSAVGALLAYVDDPVHGRAAWSALEANQDRLLDHLLRRAASSRPSVAHNALDALERLAPDRGVDALRPLLRRRSHSAGTARVLARIDSPEAQDALLENLREPGVREAFRFAGIGMEARLRAGLDRGSLSNRLQRIDLLGLCGREASVARLEALGEDPAVAPQVVVALGRIGGDHAAKALGRLAERTALLRPAVDALGWTGSTAAVPILLHLARHERGLMDPVLRALARHASPEAVKAIARLDRRGTRAARTLREMDPEVVVPALIAMLDMPDADAARRALRALGHPVPAAPGARARLN